MRQMKICPIRCHHTIIIIIIIILVIVLDTMGLVVECVNKIQCKNRTAIPVFFCLLITNFFSNINFLQATYISLSTPPPLPFLFSSSFIFFVYFYFTLQKQTVFECRSCSTSNWQRTRLFRCDRSHQPENLSLHWKGRVIIAIFFLSLLLWVVLFL